MDDKATNKTFLPAIEDFVEDILNQAYPNESDKLLRNQMKVDLTERVDEYITRKIINALPDDKLEEFSELLDMSADDGSSQRFISENIADLDKLLEMALAEFRDLYTKK